MVGHNRRRGFLLAFALGVIPPCGEWYASASFLVVVVTDYASPANHAFTDAVAHAYLAITFV